MAISAENWRRVKTLYQRAIETAPEKRLVFLRRVCKGDEELRREIESMLAFSDGADDVFEKPVFDAVKLLAEDSESLKIGERIDSYNIIRECGHGGMGVVYLAERTDGFFEQQAAVKIIKRGMDTDAILRRFALERQILASLDHPNIARLFGGGTTNDGLPYFVMEYVEGLPVLEFCESENLNLNERLRLFRKICEAVSYAHQNLVVHRDLKPSNILITKTGEPKLLDFGIAKLLHAEATGATELTETGKRLLTPEYASPEQIKGERITTQSDVYSLGVLLSKLIQNSKFKIQDFSSPDPRNFIVETERKTKDKEQRTKDRLQKPKTEIEAILQTALHEDLARRYSSVEQFSDDIRRYLEGLPVFARKDSFAYRAAKFVYRNQTAVFASVFFMVGLIGATIFSVYQMQKANAAQERAERRFNEVRKLAGTMIFEYSDRIENLSGSTELREKMLKDSVEYLDSLSQEAIKDNSLLNEIGAAYLKIGDAQGKPFAANAGNTKAALESYQKAETVFQDLTLREPENTDFAINLSRAYENIGKIQMRELDYQNSIESHRKAIEIRQKLLEKNPSEVVLRELLADSFLNLGDAVGVKSNLVEADSSKYQIRVNLTAESLNHFLQSLEIRQKLLDENPSDLMQLGNLARCYQRMGFRMMSFGEWKENYKVSPPNDNRDAADFFREAIKFHEKSVEIKRLMAAKEPENTKFRRNLADEQMILADPLIKMNKFDAAEKHLFSARSVFEELAEKDAANLEAKRDLVNVYDRIGRLFIARKNQAKATENYQKALEIMEKIIAANPTESDRLQLQGLRWMENNVAKLIAQQSK